MIKAIVQATEADAPDVEIACNPGDDDAAWKPHLDRSPLTPAVAVVEAQERHVNSRFGQVALVGQIGHRAWCIGQTVGTFQDKRLGCLLPFRFIGWIVIA